MNWRRHRKKVASFIIVIIFVAAAGNAQRIQGFIDWVRVGSSFNRGVSAILINDNQLAVQHFSTAIELDSSFTPAYKNRGVAYFKLGDYSKSIADFQTSLTQQKANADIHINLGQAHFKLQEYATSITHYSKALTHNEQSIDAYLGRGWIHYKQKAYSKALEDFEQAIQVDQKSPEAYWGRFLIYARLKGFEKAVEDYAQYRQVVSWLDDPEIFPFEPDHENAYMAMGAFRYEQDDRSGAIKFISQAIELNPKNSIAYLLRGGIYLEKEKYRLALDDKEQALGYISSKEAGIGVNLSFDEAKQAPKVLGLIENSPAALQGIQIGDYILAVDSQSIKNMNLDSIIQRIAGEMNSTVELRIGREGQEAFNIQLTREVKLNDTLLAAAFSGRAIAHYGLENSQQALADCQRVQKLIAYNAVAYERCGNIQQLMGNRDSAIADYQKALQLYTQQESDIDTDRIKGILEELQP